MTGELLNKAMNAEYINVFHGSGVTANYDSEPPLLNLHTLYYRSREIVLVY